MPKGWPADKCPICRGRGIITLPLYRSTLVINGPEIELPERLEEVMRTYPCPECAPVASKDSLRRMQMGAQIALQFTSRGEAAPPEYKKAARRDIAYMLAQEMLKNGTISFDEVAGSDFSIGRPSIWLRGTIWMVAPAVARHFERQLALFAIEHARKIAKYAIDQIAVWRRDYADNYVRKDYAARQINDAVRRAEKELLPDGQ